MWIFHFYLIETSAGDSVRRRVAEARESLQRGTKTTIAVAHIAAQVRRASRAVIRHNHAQARRDMTPALAARVRREICWRVRARASRAAIFVARISRTRVRLARAEIKKNTRPHAGAPTRLEAHAHDFGGRENGATISAARATHRRVPRDAHEQHTHEYVQARRATRLDARARASDVGAPYDATRGAFQAAWLGKRLFATAPERAKRGNSFALPKRRVRCSDAILTVCREM